MPSCAIHRLLYEHPRFEGVEAEEHHLISGPSVQGAAALFAQGVVEAALALHRGSVHLLHVLEVATPGSAARDCCASGGGSGGGSGGAAEGAGGQVAPGLLGGAAAALMGVAGASAAFGDGIDGRVFGLAELLSAAGREVGSTCNASIVPPPNACSAAVHATLCTGRMAAGCTA